MLPGRTPAPDATMFRFGKQRMRRTMPGAVAGLALGLSMPVACLVYGYGVGTWVFAVIWFLVCGTVAVVMAWAVWSDRDAYLAFDTTGVWWWRNKTSHAVIPWDSLDAVGLFWCPQGTGNSGHRLVSLELCPTGGVQEPQDPALAPLFIEEQSGVAGVPDRRYRIGLPVFVIRHYGGALIEAARSRAAHRWFGEHERPAGYLRAQDLIS
ncbi:hypothetical protein Sgleb_74350 [Streptomyces glebosus]|uniref:Uncharacterized protein n=1 Tax=Streptomyces glebosus TaxID=249580 RepID=A0A640T7V8_9ACTN|nr:hypothetical protein [Streptomyces glebosus]GFE19388.1 hypothetical protein Sgleb_74350 [Streptomyces glebosus]GHG62680.1 hypothetical protein GCM10010513_29560 [Streptomyces glebosus]